MIKSSTLRRITLILVDICCFVAVFITSSIVSEKFSSTSVPIENPAFSYMIIGGIFGASAIYASCFGVQIWVVKLQIWVLLFVFNQVIIFS